LTAQVTKGMSTSRRKRNSRLCNEETEDCNEESEGSCNTNKRRILTKGSRRLSNKHGKASNDTPSNPSAGRQRQKRQTTLSTERFLVSQISEMMVEQAQFWRRHSNYLQTVCHNTTSQFAQHDFSFGSELQSNTGSNTHQSMFHLEDNKNSEKGNQDVIQLRNDCESFQRQIE
jgi:hypothetical protein